jgi:hypothetical protein
MLLSFDGDLYIFFNLLKKLMSGVRDPLSFVFFSRSGKYEMHSSPLPPPRLPVETDVCSVIFFWFCTIFRCAFVSRNLASSSPG